MPDILLQVLVYTAFHLVITNLWRAMLKARFTCTCNIIHVVLQFTPVHSISIFRSSRHPKLIKCAEMIVFLYSNIIFCLAIFKMAVRYNLVLICWTILIGRWLLYFSGYPLWRRWHNCAFIGLSKWGLVQRLVIILLSDIIWGSLRWRTSSDIRLWNVGFRQRTPRALFKIRANYSFRYSVNGSPGIDYIN